MQKVFVKLNIQKFLIIFLGFLAILSFTFYNPDSTLAQQITVKTSLTGEKDISSVGQFLGEILNWAGRFGVAAAVLMVVFAGFRIVTSGGSSEVVAQAKEIIAGAILGLAVIFLIGALLKLLINPGLTP